MEPDEFFGNLRARLVGHRVRFRRLACDSLLIYIDCEPGDESGITLWFDPIWHYCGPQGVLVGSMQVAEACDTEETMAAVADEPMALLLGRAIEDVIIEPRSFDLIVTFQDDYYIKTFVSDPTRSESWHIRDNPTGKRLNGSPRGLAVVPANPLCS